MDKMNKIQGRRLFKAAVQKKHAGKLEEALEHLEGLLSMPASDRQNVLMEKAHILYRLGYFEKCIECIDQCRMINDIDSDTSTSHLPRGSAWIDGADAVDEVDPEALLLKSLALDRLGKPKEAGRCLKESTAAAKKLSLSGHACDWWAEQASNFCHIGWWERAIFCEDGQLKLDPDNLSTLHEKACQLSNMGKHAESLPLFDKAMKMGQDDEDYWFLLVNKGRALMHLGQSRKAIELFNLVLSNETKFEDCIGEVWYEKGRALMRLRQFEEALNCFEQAIESCYRAEGWFGKGRALAALNQNKEAILCLDQALISNSGLTAARLLRGKLLKKQLTHMSCQCRP
jgi:tetratricopeptide (TPR) repeat protein